MNLFDLFATLKLDTSGFEKGVAAAKSQMKGIEKSFSGFGNAIGGIGSSLKAVGQNLTNFGNKVTSIGRTASVVTAGVGAVLAGAFVKAKDYIGTYESAMATFRHSAQIGEEGAQALYDSLLKVAKNSAYAQERFLSAGQSLVAMGLSANDTTKYIQAITDVTAKMGGSGQQIEEMADLFGKLSLQTNLYTQDINQMVTAGIPAWDILATHYHTTTDEVKKMAREGLLPAKESLDIITGALEETNEASEMFKFSAAGMAAELKSGTLTGALDSLNTSFRTFALNLLDLDPKTESGKENIKTLNATIAKFGETMENVGSRFSFVGDWIKIGLENITRFLENLNRTIENMPQEQLESLVRIIGTIAVAGPALIIVGKAISTIGSAISGVGALFSGLSGVLSSVGSGLGMITAAAGGTAAAFGIISAVVVALIALFIVVKENWDKIVQAFTEWYEKSGIKEKLEAVGAKLSELWNKLGSLHDLFVLIGSVLGVVLMPIIIALQGVISGVITWFDGLITMISGFVDILAGVGEIIMGILTGDQEKIKDGFNKFLSGIGEILSGAFNMFFGSIGSYLSSVWAAIESWFNAFGINIGNFLTNTWNSITSWLSNLWDSLTSWFANMWDKITQWGSNVLNNIREKWEAIKQSITQAITNAYNEVSSWINRIKDNVSNVFNNIKSIVTNIWNSIASKASEIWGNITGTIKGAMDRARDIVRNIIDAIKGFFNFHIEWPHIPMPHFNINPNGWQIGDLLHGSIPSLSIDWYAKGGIFTKPTIFPTLNGLTGVGEAGAEAVLPIKTLRGYIVDAMAEGVKEANVLYKDSASAKANTGLVNGLISALQSEEKGSINVYIGGKLIANEIYDPLMNIMKNKEVIVSA